MKKSILFIALLSFVTTLFAQEQPVILKGRVVDSLTRRPLPFAAIQISLQGKAYPCVANDSGMYQISLPDTGSYTFAANYLGYNVYAQTVSIQHKTAMQDLLLSRQVKTLNGVEVKSSQPYIAVQRDKIVVNIAQSPLAAGDNAYQALKRAPGVMDQQGLKLRGKTVTVYINGRPSRLSGQELENYLSAMPANTIESFELMPNPSAKYEADGAAVINIVLAKNKSLGTNGTVNLGAGMGNHLLYNGGVSLNYRDKVLNVYGSYDYMNRSTDATNTATRTISKNYIIQDQQHAENDLQSHTYKLGFDRTIDKRSSFGALLRGNIRTKEQTMANTSRLPNDSSSVLDKVNHTNFQTPAVNVYFKTLLGKQKNELTLNGDYYSYDKKANDNLTTRNFDAQGMGYGQPSQVRYQSPANNQVFSFSGDYNFKAFKTTFESGVKSIFTKTDNNLIWENFDANNWKEDIFRSNHFIYKENVYSAYLTASRTFHKFDMQAGLRVEHTDNSGNSVTLSQVHNNGYTNLFPSLSINFNQSEKQQFTFAYSRKIERFGLDIVNPFLVYQSQYQYSKGNPAIKPTLSDNLELGWMYNNSWMASIGYGHFSDVLAEVYHREDNSAVTIGTYDNVASGDQLMLGLSYYKGFLKDKIYTVTSVNALYAKYNAPASTKLDKSGIGAMASNNTSFKLDGNWKAEINTSYTSPLKFGAYDFRSQFSMGLGVTRSVLQKKGSLTLNVSDVFNTEKRNYSILSYDVAAVLRNNPETRFVKLVFNYRFGNQQVKTARARRTNIDEVKQRMQD